MNIIILGAGQVGATLAENLVREENDITLIDTRSDRLRELQNRLDISTVTGSAAHPRVLRQAGAENADMLIAVTNSDEVNLVACQVAQRLFRTPTKIARIRAEAYQEESEILFTEHGFAIDVLISPEQLVTDLVTHLIEYPGALQVLDFAEGLVRLVALRPQANGPLLGKTLEHLQYFMPQYQARIVAIFRDEKPLVLSDDLTIELNDEVFFVAASQHVLDVMSALRRLDHPYRRVMIAGGGNIGYRLAKNLEHDYQVKMIDHNVTTTNRLAASLDKTIVLLGDATDRELLTSENIEYTDVFCAVTNDDEVNIMSCLQAKRLGARHVMALITRTAYADLVIGGEIDTAISPQQATIGSILTHIRRGDIVHVHSLRRGAAEAIEVVAHGDKETSYVVGKSLMELELPKDIVVGAIVRGGKVIIPDPSTVFETEDHVILFLIDKQNIDKVERLFQVNVTFM